LSRRARAANRGRSTCATRYAAKEIDRVAGILSLESPGDLLRKLEHDVERLRAKKDDIYAAFDFFVTAEHMLDWLYPGYEGKSQRKKERDDSILLQVVSHIASGAKHFDSLGEHHETVESALPAGRYFAGGYFGQGYFGEGYFGVSTVMVQLLGKAIPELGERIPALQLAELVLAFWKRRLTELAA
jgi:hypothetical protein